MSLIACITSAFSSLITSGLLCLPSLPIHRRSLCGSSCWSCVTVSVPRVWGVVPFPMLSFSDIVYIPALSCTSIIVKIFIFTCPSSLFHRAFVGGPVIQVGLCAGQVNTLNATKQETDDRSSELPVLALQARISLVRRFKFEFLNLPRTGQRPRRVVRKKGQYVGYSKTGDQ